MKTSKLIPILFAATLGFSGLAMANCADDAINTCNAKHPDPDKNYGAYELCIKAQLGQKCPSSASAHPTASDVFATHTKPTVPPTRIRSTMVHQPTATRSSR
ncbi:hypothetical protein [Nitrincola sp. MINF-07-Sa-05]|uniref:hypothetical protein n=1 Tax=Nitrincola salilacus TaxID=3400273 RepID=UPI003917D9B6